MSITSPPRVAIQQPSYLRKSRNPYSDGGESGLRGRVTVTLRLIDPQTVPRIEFEVADTGIGIGPQPQAHLFQTFAQADSCAPVATITFPNRSIMPCS